MLAIDSQTAGTNRLTFFEETQGYPRGNMAKKFKYFLSPIINFFFKYRLF